MGTAAIVFGTVFASLVACHRRTGFAECSRPLRVKVTDQCEDYTLFESIDGCTSIGDIGDNHKVELGPLTTTQGGWANSYSPNIGEHAHVIHTTRRPAHELIFPTEMGFQPTVAAYHLNGDPTTHGDIGSLPHVLEWMINQADEAMTN